MRGFSPAIAALGFATGELLVRWTSCELAYERFDNFPGNLVLDRENVLEASVETFGPEMSSADCIDQLRVDTHTIRGAPYASLQQVADPQFLGNPAHVSGLILVHEARVPRGDVQVRNPRQIRDYILGQSIRKGGVPQIVAHVAKGQYSDRWSGRGRRRPLVVTEALNLGGETVSDPRDRCDPLAALRARTKKLPQGSYLN
ncbi:hypothetical protein EV184_111179 [Sinorhizobium americanum]|uniref:Uncharacterized protein n=1 Tax=Sinorhizobium americanum TaxID=194963 RepID=A0A4R2BNI9_9HYPH|nr:hypothetical protein EV184_111179 [Sinorhizobium americanum]